MSIRSVDENRHYFLVATRLLKGKVVPFLGAGANLCGRPDGQAWKRGEYLPSGAELAQELAATVMYPDDDDRDLMRISQFVDAVLGPDPLYELMREQFDAPYPPTALHRFLATVAGMLRERGRPRQVILTTNYDDALERAFVAAREPFDLIWYQARGPHSGHFMHDDDGTSVPILLPNEYDEIDPDERTVIVKLHGAMVPAQPAQDSYVITEDDYIHYLTRSEIASQLPALLSARIKESHLLFLGYSMRDWNLRVVLERLGGSEVMTNQSWAVQREPTKAVSKEIEQTLWSERDVELLYILLDEYVDKLGAQLTRELERLSRAP